MKRLYKKYDFLIRRFFREIGRFRVSLYAANASFYIFLSVFPAAMLAVGLLPHFGFSHHDLIEFLQGFVPDVFSPLLERTILDTSGTLVSLSAVTAIWSSSRGVYCIQLGLNGIHGVRESRSYFHRRILCMLYMLLLILALMLTLVIHGFGKELALWFSHTDIPILCFLSDVLQFRGLILFILLTLLFSAVFSVLPNRQLPFRSCLPGAALAAFGWLLFTLGFSWYARATGSYSVIYGSLSIVAMSMLWLYICISILFYGSVFNLFLERKWRIFS